MEVADFLIKAGADIELGCSTPLMEAAQEGHLELVKYLLAAGEQENGGKGDLKTEIKRVLSLTQNVIFVYLCYNPERFGFVIQEQTFMPPRQQVTQH